MQQIIRMSEYCIIAIIVLFSCTAQRAGYMHTDQKYIGIFHNVTPGRLSFQTVNIDKDFLLTHEQTIDFQWNEKIPGRIKTYGVHLEKMFHYNNTRLYFISYLYDAGKPANQVAVDFVSKDISGSHQYYSNLKEFTNINFGLSFAKIINNILFFSFSDNQEILYTMELDSGRYEVKEYNHQVGVIRNIWLKVLEDTEYVFTSEKDQETISGVFRITGQNSTELMEIHDYKVVGYNSFNGSFFYYNQDNILLYRSGNDLADYIIKEFMGEGETIYDTFILDDGSFIIGSTKSGPDHFSNFFFGSGHLIHYFYYYHIQEHGHDNLIIKNIRTFGSLWRLEQLIFK